MKGVLSCTVVLYKCIPCSGMAVCVAINTCSISLLYCIATGMYEGVPGGVAGLSIGCCCVYITVGTCVGYVP